VSLRYAIRELRELGLKRTLFRVQWEARNRLPFGGDRAPADAAIRLRTEVLPFSAPDAVRAAVADRIPADALERLRAVAAGARHGKIVSFSHATTDFGDPVDWFRDPETGRRWPQHTDWRTALRTGGMGDVKLTWEIGRFPQAYALARAGAFFPAEREEHARVFASQVADFSAANPFGRGIHWASSQEIVFRIMAWLYAARVLLAPDHPLFGTLAREVRAMAAFTEEHIDYARMAVYNNHLLSEALGLFVAGVVLEGAPEAERWRQAGLEILVEQADRQFYEDGSYIQQSHTYHRVALHDLHWCIVFCRAAGMKASAEIERAVERSLDFLYAHQNERDGWLPNYGTNDGALPGIYSVCDYRDFRPVLQAASIATRGERIYAEGPWDEEPAWLFGADSAGAPLRRRDRRSVSFGGGHHVLRGEESFATFRCGTLRDRFTQMDMLHVDLWRRGVNLLVDGGSYLYNGPAAWQKHFVSTTSHNTVTVDGMEQMVHYRKFKLLYPPDAALLEFNANAATGEHYAFRREGGDVVHRRSVAMVGEDRWLVLDTITGSGTHDVRLHWLANDFPVELHDSGIYLVTAEGRMSVTVHGGDGRALPLDVVKGDADTPRGWLSGHYAEKIAVPSIAVHLRGELPLSVMTIVAPRRPEVSVSRGVWRVADGEGEVAIRVSDGRLQPA
jgi:asparagine synthase (glutamine-hydrolysing)